MCKVLFEFIADERGSTAIEYAMIASLIAGVIVTAVTLIGTDLKDIFNNVSAGFP